VEDRDPVGQLFGLVQVLRGEQHGRALVGELLDGVPHLDPGLRVETGGRLVEEHHRRVAHEAHGDVEPAPHTARVGRHLPPAGPRQRESGQQPVSDRARVLEVP